MKDKRPQKNLVMSTDKFAIVRVKRQENHKLKSNEVILPRADYRPDTDHKLIWFDEKEPMIYRERYGELPKCYWDYLEDIKISFSKPLEVQVIRTTQENPERWEEQIGAIICKHQLHKSKILNLIENIDFNDSSCLFDLNILSPEMCSKEEVIQAVNDVPFFFSDICRNTSIFIGDTLDESAKRLIELQIKDNRNEKKGIVSYYCLEGYMDNRYGIHLSRWQKEFVIKQYEGKRGRKGLKNTLENRGYKRILKIY